MSWKRILYVMVIILVAGISALSGAVAGGVAVYSAMVKSASKVSVTLLPTPAVANEIQISSTQSVNSHFHSLNPFPLQ